MGKKGEPVVHEDEPQFAIGRAIRIREGREVCLLSTGNLLPTAIETAGELAREGINAQVTSFHTVKPTKA